MKHRPTASALNHLEARQEMLEQQLADMKDQVYGRNTSFLPMITNKNGTISEWKLDNFIKALTNGVFGSGVHGIITLPEFREMCECFLYCTIQGIAEYNERYRQVERASCCFSDIVAMARHKNNLLFSQKDILHRYEYETASTDEADEAMEVKFINELQWGGFFRSCDVAYRILTGRSVTETFPQEELNALYDAEMLSIAQGHGFDTVEEFLKWQEEADEAEKELEFIHSPAETDEVQLDEFYSEMVQTRLQKNEEWRLTVVSPEKFIEKYLRFRELFFQLDMYYRYNLFEYVELMSDLYLYERGLTALADDESFAAVYHKTKRLSASVKNEVSRGGRS